MALPQSIACFKWPPHPGYRSTFTSEAVNVLRAMVAKHYPSPYRFVCFTNERDGIDARVEVLPLWSDFAHVPSPHGGKNPSCYRRLKLSAPEMASILGQRFVSLDLDTVITGELTPLWDRPEDIVLYGDTNPRTHYNGSMVLMTAGARSKVWETFDPKVSPQKSKAAGCWGSDQGWISYCLGPGEAKWGKHDGVYSYRNHIKPNHGVLPANAKMVIFHGAHDPWHPLVSQLTWVRQNYSLEVAA